MLQAETTNPAVLVGVPTPMLVGPALGATGAAVAGATFGVLLGSAVLTGLVAWAFHAHNPTRPKWKPALILGGSSAVFGLLGIGLSASRSAAGMFGTDLAYA